MTLEFNPEYTSQSIITTIVVKEKAKRVRFDLDYIESVDKWYIGLYNAQTGESYCINIPLVASYSVKNNLFAPYHYKNIGELVCVPIVDDVSSVDPTKDNLMTEFAVIWGETIA